MATKRIFIFLGAPGAGKGSQAKLLSRLCVRPLLLIGDALREISNQDTQLGLEVRHALASGKLMDNRIIAEIIKTRSQSSDFQNGFVIDGYPRNLRQAEWLDTWAAQQASRVVAIYLSIAKEILVDRVLNRTNCTVCGEVFNLLTAPPRVLGSCDCCGKPLTRRTDDIKQALEQRYDTFESETLPLVDYYKKQGRLVWLDAHGTKESVFRELQTELRMSQGVAE